MMHLTRKCYAVVFMQGYVFWGERLFAVVFHILAVNVLEDVCYCIGREVVFRWCRDYCSVCYINQPQLL